MYGKSIYGISQYGLNANDIDIPDIDNPNLMKYLPNYYKNSNIIINIFDSISKNMGIMNYDLQDLKNQFFTNSATWGLNYWEKDYGITTDLSLSYETRRENIKSKIRGRGTSTIKMIENTALAFTNAEIQVIENYSDYSFIIKFVGVKGIPKNMAGFIDIIEAIKPAHLAYTIEYSYTIWDFVKSSNLSWENIKSKTWDEIKTYE